MQWKSLTPAQALVVCWLATLVFAALFGASILGIRSGWVPPSFLFGPIGGVLVAVGGLAVAMLGARTARAEAEAAYVRGQNEVPPWAEAPSKVPLSTRPPPPPPLASPADDGEFPVTLEAPVRKEPR